MKKAMPILLIVAFLGLILQVVVTIFITEADSEYVLKTEDNIYTITEHLEVIDDISFYDFGITDQNGDFYSFSLSEDFNKQTEIITDVKYFKSNEVACIFPVYKREKTSDVACLYHGQPVSYSYLRQISNEDINTIVGKLKKDKYTHNSWDRETPEKVALYQDGRGIEVYQENIMKDYIFLIWRYKGLYLLKNEESIIKDYLESDIYDNSMSMLVGRYYVTAERRTDVFRISELSYYNTRELGRGKISLLEATSTNFYFNGVYKNQLYMTDVGAGKQYSIDPAHEKVVEVGNKQTEFVNVVNGKKVKVSPNEFLASPVYFTDTVINEEISTKYGDGLEIYKDRQFYYFKTNDGTVYRAHEKDPTHAEILFKFNNLTEWKVDNGDLIAVAGDTVYFYTDSEGLIPIAINSELNYNHKNIVDFWKK